MLAPSIYDLPALGPYRAIFRLNDARVRGAASERDGRLKAKRRDQRKAISSYRVSLWLRLSGERFTGADSSLVLLRQIGGDFGELCKGSLEILVISSP